MKHGKTKGMFIIAANMIHNLNFRMKLRQKLSFTLALNMYFGVITMVFGGTIRSSIQFVIALITTKNVLYNIFFPHFIGIQTMIITKHRSNA